ncbi:hypothetical protein NQZ68_029361 [Dissostichus eleginoides]|nr:hypothetical protein NQZ68_029361 [Dissostichus eleginoides]
MWKLMEEEWGGESGVFVCGSRHMSACVAVPSSRVWRLGFEVRYDSLQPCTPMLICLKKPRKLYRGTIIESFAKSFFIMLTSEAAQHLSLSITSFLAKKQRMAQTALVVGPT